jgi:hypothetical protein
MRESPPSICGARDLSAASPAAHSRQAGRSIRTIAKDVLEALLVIALFTTLIIGVMELKLAIWTPFFHR